MQLPSMSQGCPAEPERRSTPVCPTNTWWRHKTDKQGGRKTQSEVEQEAGAAPPSSLPPEQRTGLTPASQSHGGYQRIRSAATGASSAPGLGGTELLQPELPSHRFNFLEISISRRQKGGCRRLHPPPAGTSQPAPVRGAGGRGGVLMAALYLPGTSPISTFSL